VIISDVDSDRTGIRPSENQTPLIVDSHAVPTHSVPFESFKAVARRRGEIVQLFGIMQHIELPGSDLFDTDPSDTLPHSALFEEPLDGWIGKALNGHNDYTFTGYT
jgi:hypothetical protein